MLPSAPDGQTPPIPPHFRPADYTHPVLNASVLSGQSSASPPARQPTICLFIHLFVQVHKYSSEGRYRPSVRVRHFC